MRATLNLVLELTRAISTPEYIEQTRQELIRRGCLGPHDEIPRRRRSHHRHAKASDRIPAEVRVG